MWRKKVKKFQLSTISQKDWKVSKKQNESISDEQTRKKSQNVEKNLLWRKTQVGENIVTSLLAGWGSFWEAEKGLKERLSGLRKTSWGSFIADSATKAAAADFEVGWKTLITFSVFGLGVELRACEVNICGSRQLHVCSFFGMILGKAGV